MAIQQTEQWSCDLCSRKSTSVENKTPKGWVKIEIDGFVDRTWETKCVCDSCSKEIVYQFKKSN